MLNNTGVQNSYVSGVRIANWNEEKQLQELNIAQFLKRKANGELLVNKVQAHLNASLAEVELTKSEDGFLRYGDNLMLYSVATEGVLSVDTATKSTTYTEGYSATSSSLTQAHVARNTFIIEPVSSDAKLGDVIKLGAPLRIRVNNSLSANDIYLSSQPTSSISCARVSRQQDVFFSATNNFDTVWVPVFKDITQRFEMEGQPVPANAEICLLHAQTRNALFSSPKFEVHNDFGKEYEVSGASDTSINTSQGLYAELQGKTTGDIQTRPESIHNHWAFLSAK